MPVQNLKYLLQNDLKEVVEAKAFENRNRDQNINRMYGDVAEYEYSELDEELDEVEFKEKVSNTTC